MMILDRIVETKEKEVRRLKETCPLSDLKETVNDMPPARSFRAAISGRPCSVIAEVKRHSPSKGLIREDFDPAAIASVYEKNGASAVSVLTDEHYFRGKGSYIADIKNTVRIPVLRKDFIIDPYQIYETRVMGADAVLLITRILKSDMLERCIGLAGSLGLSALVEVHSEKELEIALGAGADIIGINNRDLGTFKTDLQNSLDLAPLIPDDRVAVSESGIHARKDIEILMINGIHSFLVGEALMKEQDIGRKLRELLGREV
ncbi:MAG TPA: indole-3-glycerol phosphate synthase TrpC [Desulfobacteraceae bacterium]|nr:indole-3-glycerol phosphate synthase TrpC [Desulfobacteraceae bacterium]HPJ68501.1 indole-3-glycerol phosphate synthase TrpC [Desulfobacteraceae bacterium]HPQ27259.1 indole-3-glycerol phosphate synthase TrpC [Desulfobacteraceae bacterium]